MNINRIDNSTSFNGKLSMENALKAVKNNPKSYYFASGMSGDTFSGKLESRILYDVHRSTKGLERHLSYNSENGDLLVNIRKYDNGNIYILSKTKTRWVFVNKEGEFFNIPKFRSRKEFIKYWKEMLPKIM